eukprot:10961848-Lingulodinium_polyedra.AAC.1
MSCICDKSASNGPFEPVCTRIAGGTADAPSGSAGPYAMYGASPVRKRLDICNYATMSWTGALICMA